MSTVFDTRQCTLGEGPLWHPGRKQLFWFDILNKQLMTQEAGAEKSWQFDEHVSAAGWVSHHALLIASETKLFLFDLDNGASQMLCELEANNPVTRSNDGRADPCGGFWIGTMGKNAEQGAGSIYRFYQGRLQKLFSDLTITNAICFSPDGQTAFFTDSSKGVIQEVTLDENGWPQSGPKPFVDLSAETFEPDGAVVDAVGYLWNAQWGAGRIARYTPDGSFAEEITFNARQTSCPAFGGDELNTLFATSAAIGLDGEDDGKTFSVTVPVHGQAEHQVLL